MRITKETQETLNNLRAQGVKFNITNRVDHRIELHNYYENLNGTEGGHFVAEVDDYGNVTAWGPYLEEDKPAKPYVLNADGEAILLSSIKD